MYDAQQVLTSLDSLARIQDNQRVHVLPTGALRVDPANWTQFVRRSWNADCRSRTVSAIQTLITAQLARARSEAHIIAETRELVAQGFPALTDDMARRESQLVQLCEALDGARSGVGKLVSSTYKDDDAVCVALSGVCEDIHILLNEMSRRFNVLCASAPEARPDSPS